MLHIDHLIEEALREDIGTGDHSTLSCIPKEAKGKALLKIKQDGVLAGMEVAEIIFRKMEKDCKFFPFKKDGDKMAHGEIAFEVSAHVHTILSAERLVLNCMQRMSGIATLTKAYADKLQGYHTRILDTRKTTPNFRILEKEAVRIGGGINHRFGLYDMIMLKDNHIDYAGGIKQAITRAHEYVVRTGLPIKIEVETRSLEDVKKVIAIGEGKVFRIMLDNFTPEELTEALALIDHRFESEASGGINLETVTQYAKTGVDYVSVGGLIHQAKSLDLSLKAEIEK
ncbi:carboxylating nicotinate-nucleotide diphosphorylase [Arachidicoccus ginsenosidivorans]|jgi:nicotinate-nucleotide pyrophosphorylase (carboxylating)|uniref:Probable nicotinate-nucleotide pyrophosphorylase [carboxylating] n=1 Tax=Arachidicoccus ginsenosidivorans TaxID=496057 RepID=A0A5B8VP24_9BACT|nr:carboxylating nicotinate-nucleotide diphosphorylase [Arachidicoccus ginsenosidivorans]QEC73179.1 carboxylating nicotinate-nucleotide diphosphorylase [Arachidicoccus ginsenosidivorans]